MGSASRFLAGLEAEPHRASGDRDHVLGRRRRHEVDLEHRGWERLGAKAEEALADFGRGWTGTLARFAS